MSNYSNNGYGNNPYDSINNNQAYGSNPYENNNNRYNNQGPSSANIKPIKISAISYIFLFFASLIFSIAAYAALVNDVVNGTITSNSIMYIVFLIIAIVISIATFITSIVFAIQAGNIKRYYKDFNSVFVLAIVGIFVVLLTLIASFMTLSRVKRMK